MTGSGMSDDPDRQRRIASAIFEVAMREAGKHRGDFEEIMLHLWLELTANIVENGTPVLELLEYHLLEAKAEAARRDGTAGNNVFQMKPKG